MPCRTTVNISQSAINNISNAAKRALIKTGEAMHTEIVHAQVIPRDKGTLSGEGFFVDDSGADWGIIHLVHNTPYARRLYFHPEYNFSKLENPNAKGKWFEDWIEGNKKERFARVFAKKLKEEGGF